jgi:hypothetical protein
LKGSRRPRRKACTKAGPLDRRGADTRDEGAIWWGATVIAKALSIHRASVYRVLEEKPA